MQSRTARKRFEFQYRQLMDLQRYCKECPQSELVAAFGRYQRAIDQKYAGWRKEMERRAGLLREEDGDDAPAVWDLVRNIREVFGEAHGAAAAEMAVTALAPLLRRPKRLSASGAI